MTFQQSPAFYFSQILYCYLQVHFFSNYLTPKWEKWFFSTNMLLLLLEGFLLSPLYHEYVLRAIISALFFLADLALFYKGSFSRKLSAFVLNFITLTTGDIVISGLCLALFQINELQAVKDPKYQIIVPVLGCIYFVIIYEIILKWACKKMKNISSKHYFIVFLYLLLLFILSSCISQFVIYYIPKNPDGSYVLMLITAFICCLLILVVSFLLLYLSSKKAQLSSQNLYLKEQQELQLQHYTAMQDEEIQMNLLRHDIRNHICTIQQLLNQGDTVEAQSYAAEILTKFHNIPRIGYCENKIVDAILFGKMRYAKAHNIDMKTDIKISQDCSIEKVDLVSVFSNILDNAFNACATNAQTENNYVVVSAIQNVGILSIKVTNSVSEYKTNKVTKSRGQMKIKHGLGLTIIQDICTKYDGCLFKEEISNSFSVYISLRENNNTVL